MSNLLDEGIIKMKKMIYVLPMILTSAMYAMQEGQSDQIYIPSNAQITYKITNASSEKVNMELFKIDKSSQRIRAEALLDTWKKESEQKYDLKNINGRFYIVPRYVTMIMGFKLEKSGISCESREIDLSTNAHHHLMITFNEDAYRIDLERNASTEQIDADTIANAKTRVAEHNKKSDESKSAL